MTNAYHAIFKSAEPDDFRSPLLNFLVLSIIGHLAVFYSLQVVYPPPVAQFPADARLALLSPATTSQAMLAWVESNDLMSARRSAELDGRSLTYSPSYAGGQPVLLDAPVLNPLRLPGAMSLGSKLPVLIVPDKEEHRMPAAGTVAAGIFATFEGDDTGAFPVPRFFLGSLPLAEAGIRLARFGYAWRQTDVGPYVFVIDSTGDDDLDARIAKGLRKVRPNRAVLGDIFVSVNIRITPLKAGQKALPLP